MPGTYRPCRQAACEAEAGRIMSRLESAKNRGEDYSLADIRALRKTCQVDRVLVGGGAVKRSV